MQGARVLSGELRGDGADVELAMSGGLRIFRYLIRGAPGGEAECWRVESQRS
jgi:hypothetical protein